MYGGGATSAASFRPKIRWATLDAAERFAPDTSYDNKTSAAADSPDVDRGRMGSPYAQPYNSRSGGDE